MRLTSEGLAPMGEPKSNYRRQVLPTILLLNVHYQGNDSLVKATGHRTHCCQGLTHYFQPSAAYFMDHNCHLVTTFNYCIVRQQNKIILSLQTALKKNYVKDEKEKDENP
jgi:hypothetical protein